MPPEDGAEEGVAAEALVSSCLSLWMTSLILSMTAMLPRLLDECAVETKCGRKLEQERSRWGRVQLPIPLVAISEEADSLPLRRTWASTLKSYIYSLSLSWKEMKASQSCKTLPET